MIGDLLWGVVMVVTIVVGTFAFIVVGWICRDEPRSAPWPPETLPPPLPIERVQHIGQATYTKEPLALPRGDR